MRTGCTIRGNVLLDGKEQPNCTVRVEAAAGAGVRPIWLEAGTDGHGKSTVEGVPEGSAVLVVENDAGSARVPAEVRPGVVTEVTVELRPGRGIRGWITMRGKNLEGATITAQDGDGKILGATVSDSAGRWEIKGLPAGHYTVYAEGSGLRARVGGRAGGGRLTGAPSRSRPSCGSSRPSKAPREP